MALAKIIGIAALAALLTGGGVFIWQQYQQRQAKAQLVETQQEIRTEQQQLTEVHQAELEKAVRKQLEFLATPLSWLVRRDLMRESVAQIDEYLIELVRKPGMQLIVLADRNGKIILATNKKLEQSGFAEHFPAPLLDGGEQQIERLPDGAYRLVLPVMGLNERLGTLLLLYKP